MTPTRTPDDRSGEAPARPIPAAGIRGAMARHRKATMLVSCLLIAGVGAWLTWFYWPEPDRSPPTRAWYTVDDGASWFEDDAERLPPFDHGGKPAVRLHLYSCDGGKTTFAGYTQKLPEEVFKKYRDKGIDPATVDDDELAADSGWLVKRTGGAGWVNSRDGGQDYLAIVNVNCPQGRPGKPIEVFPKNPKRR